MMTYNQHQQYNNYYFRKRHEENKTKSYSSLSVFKLYPMYRIIQKHDNYQVMINGVKLYV